MNAREVLRKAEGKYSEKAKMLRGLSLTLSQLDVEDDGDHVVKAMVIRSFASQIAPGISRNGHSLWEAALLYEGIVTAIQMVLSVSDAETEEDALAIIDRYKNQYAGLNQAFDKLVANWS